MKAIVQNDYGSPDVLELKEIDKPVIKDNEVLLRVHAAALHAGDVFAMRGVPYVVRMSAGWPKPKDYVPGYDVAGQVEAVGKDVTRFQPDYLEIDKQKGWKTMEQNRAMQIMAQGYV